MKNMLKEGMDINARAEGCTSMLLGVRGLQCGWSGGLWEAGWRGASGTHTIMRCTTQDVGGEASAGKTIRGWTPLHIACWGSYKPQYDLVIVEQAAKTLTLIIAPISSLVLTLTPSRPPGPPNPRP